MRRPLGIGTGSLAILSSLAEEEVKHVIGSNTPRLSEYGLTPTSLLAQVKRAQKLGYAVREMPTLAGVRSVGQVLRNQSGVAFAALSVSAISSRMSERRVSELSGMLKNESRLVERQLASGADRRS